MKIGMIFPGQGSQFLGMGKALYDKERLIQELFEQASQCVDQNFVRLCFASSEKELKETVNAQTAIFLVSAAIFTLLYKKYEIVPSLVAGHSSGEYAAIFAAEGMSFPDALYLLRKRALFMEEATKNQNGGMLAVIGLDAKQLQEICDKYDDSTDEHVAQIVNFNTSKQLVVSGTKPELEKIQEDVKVAGGKGILLNVAGAFHSRLMDEPGKNFAQYMLKVDFKDLKIPLVTNIEAKIVSNHKEVNDALVKQLSLPVLWWQSMQDFKDFDLIIEIGPGDKLTKMLKREWPNKNIVSVNNLDDIENILILMGRTLPEPEFADDEEVDIEIEEEIEKELK